MDNAGITNKWFAYRINICMNKNGGVAGGKAAETLTEDVHKQQESPQRCHCLTYLKLSFLLITFQYLCT